MAQRDEVRGRPSRLQSTPIPGVLDPDEQMAVEQLFGVTAEQVLDRC